MPAGAFLMALVLHQFDTDAVGSLERIGQLTMRHLDILDSCGKLTFYRGAGILPPELPGALGASENDA
jgi:hypothetical protein